MNETSTNAAPASVNEVGRGRLLAYRILAVLTALLPLSAIGFIVQSFTTDDEAIHRAHNLNLEWSLVGLVTVPLLMTLRAPVRQLAPFRLSVAYALAMIVGGILGHDFFSAFYFIVPVLVAVLLVLHPARGDVIRVGGPDVWLLVLGVLALIPAVKYGIDQGQLQYTATTDEDLLEHIEDHHFSGMAIHVLSIAFAALLASFAGSGRRIACWLVGATALLYGVTSLAFSDLAGAASTGWAIATLAWGVVFIAVAELGARSRWTATSS
jgi:hypothetical protein